MRKSAKVSAPAEGIAASRTSSAMAVEIVFPSSTEYLSLVRAAVQWFAGKRGFGDKECSRIVLAVVEAITNIIRHAYGGDASQCIQLRMSELDGGLELELLDRGKCVPQAALKGREPEKLEPGGLGLHMMRNCMDHVHYESRPQGGARLVLRKYLAGAPGAGDCGRQ